jgi:hypothetical protein
VHKLSATTGTGTLPETLHGQEALEAVPAQQREEALAFAPLLGNQHAFSFVSQAAGVSCLNRSRCCMWVTMMLSFVLPVL